VFRHSTLTASWPSAHVVPHGLHFVPTISGPFTYRTPATAGVTATAAKIQVFADLESDAAEGACALQSQFLHSVTCCWRFCHWCFAPDTGRHVGPSLLPAPRDHRWMPVRR
jgi:hypothetical protein